MNSTATDERAAALLRVASYLSRPQKFMAVADARAEMRKTLRMAEEGSVVLTTHGEPEAAVVPFSTLEDMRRALMQLLVSEMEASFARALEDQARAGERDAEATTEEEIELLVGEAVRTARRNARTSPRRKASRR
jgi:antitoxin (DNA-binding transcriptional repressor) of toxin-antitoxin stability system